MFLPILLQPNSEDSQEVTGSDQKNRPAHNVQSANYISFRLVSSHGRFCCHLYNDCVRIPCSMPSLRGHKVCFQYMENPNLQFVSWRLTYCMHTLGEDTHHIRLISSRNKSENSLHSKPPLLPLSLSLHVCVCLTLLTFSLNLWLFKCIHGSVHSSFTWTSLVCLS